MMSNLLLLALAAAWWFVTWFGSNGALESSGPWGTSPVCELMRATAMQEGAYVGICAEGPPPTEKHLVAAEYTYQSYAERHEDSYRLAYANGVPMWFAGALELVVPRTVFYSSRDDYGP